MPPTHPPTAPEPDDWNLWRSFVAVVQAGSLGRAALLLGMTQPSLSRHIRSLERRAGETLFDRRPNGLAPTARAQAMYELAEPMHDLVRRAQALLDEAPERVAGLVRVTTSEPFGVHQLPGWLAELMHAEPALEIELHVTQDTENLLRRDADIAVRFVPPQQDGLIARKVGRVHIGLYASHAYLAAFGEPLGLRDAARHVLIGPARPWSALAHPALAEVRFRFRTDAALARFAAVEAGLGIGPCLVHLASARPALKRVLAADVDVALDVWLCSHDDLRRSARLRRVYDHLAARLQAEFGG